MPAGLQAVYMMCVLLLILRCWCVVRDRPAELEQLVCGGRVVDLTALEAATHYDDGYHKDSAPVRWFWEVRAYTTKQARCEAQLADRPKSISPASFALSL